MDGGAVDSEALAEKIIFLQYFSDLPDPKQPGKVMYPLAEVLLLCLLAVLAGAETITDIARFGDKKLALLRQFRPFAVGTPAHDHVGDILASLDAEAFQRCLVAWVAALIGVPEGMVASLSRLVSIGAHHPPSLRAPGAVIGTSRRISV